MSLAATVFALAIGIFMPPQTAQDAEQGYGASVTFEQGQCVFWTGDVGLSAREFREDLIARFDRRRAIFIAYTPGTPRSCVEQAREAAMRAGFDRIKVMPDKAAGPVGPEG